MGANLPKNEVIGEPLNSFALNYLDDHIAVLDPQKGKIIAMNKEWTGFVEHNNATQEATIGVGFNYLDIYRKAIKDSDELPEQVLAGIESVLDGSKEYFTLEYPCHYLSEIRWFNMNVTHLRKPAGGAVISHTNVIQSKQSEKALHDGELKFHTLLESSPICTKIIGLDSRLLYMSTAGQTQLKISDVKTLYGCPYPPDFFPESTRTSLTKHLERAKAGETSSLECPALDIEGGELWYFTTFVPVSDNQGRIEYILVTSVNITERQTGRKNPSSYYPRDSCRDQR